MHDKVPHIERIDGKDVWMVAGERLGAPGCYSMAGWNGVMPQSVPATYDEIHPSMYDSTARLEFMDEQGLQAQLVYPNVGGFGNGYFLRLGDRELVAACVGAYNDFLTDWCSADPDRLIAVTALPFWDREMAVDELHRCIDHGHRAVNFCNQPQDYGQPHLADRHWDPIWAAAQEAGVSVSFHVGGGSMGAFFEDHAGMGWMTNFAMAACAMSTPNTISRRASTSPARYTDASGSNSKLRSMRLPDSRTTSCSRATIRTRPVNILVHVRLGSARGTTPRHCWPVCPTMWSARFCTTMQLRCTASRDGPVGGAGLR